MSTFDEWNGRSPYYRVSVRAGTVVEVRDERYRLVERPAWTIEQYWERILSARSEGILPIAIFSQDRVPVEFLIDDEAWADDSIRIRIRRFKATD